MNKVELIGGPVDGRRLSIMEGVDEILMPSRVPRGTHQVAVYRRSALGSARFTFDGYARVDRLYSAEGKRR